MSQPRETARDDPRDETEFERLDRNTVELLNEPRIAATGVQVMFAFLLIVPFNARWNRVGPFDRGDYFVTLVCVAAAAALLIAPSIHYRVLFRAGEKPYLVKVSNRCAIAGGSFLAVGLTGILVLLTTSSSARSPVRSRESPSPACGSPFRCGAACDQRAAPGNSACSSGAPKRRSTDHAGGGT
jgi:hypothetical protein